MERMTTENSRNKEIGHLGPYTFLWLIQDLIEYGWKAKHIKK